MTVLVLRDIVQLNDESQSKLYRNCINVSMSDDSEYHFVWVERRAVKAVDARHAKSEPSDDVASLNDDVVNGMLSSSSSFIHLFLFASIVMLKCYTLGLQLLCRSGSTYVEADRID
jgi:hypothetical protein